MRGEVETRAMFDPGFASSVSLRIDDLRSGVVHKGGSRTITDSEIALLPAIMGVTNPLFHDEEAARRGPYGGRVLYGPALLGIVAGLTEPAFHDILLGLVGIDAVRFIVPVHAGDTLTAWFEVVVMRPTRNRARRIATVRDWATNQRDVVVIEFQRTILLTGVAPR